MDVAYEDGRLHDDGIFGLAGYREWFHYVGTFSVSGKPLTFMLGFPRSREGTGALGWVWFNGKQYSLAGNKDTDVNRFFDLKARADINTAVPGYAKPSPYMLLRVAEELGVNPRKCAYIGNIVEYDCVAAERADMVPILLTWVDPQEVDKVSTDVVIIDHIKELQEILG